MSYEIPEEILDLFVELRGSLEKAFDGDSIEKAESIIRQMDTLAQSQMFKAIEERNNG